MYVSRLHHTRSIFWRLHSRDLSDRACMSSSTAYASLRERVRSIEPENYLCGSLLPSSARDSFFVMRAVNAEVASIRDATRGSASTARVRMAFWRTLIDAAFRRGGSEGDSSLSAVSKHPLAAPLSDAVRIHSHTKRWLDRLVDARDADLDGVPPQTVLALETYAEMTHSSLLYLSLEAVGVRDVHADHAASHIGKAAGLANVIRGLPVHARLGQRYMPDELLEKVRGLEARASAQAGPFFSPFPSTLPHIFIL